LEGPRRLSAAIPSGRVFETQAGGGFSLLGSRRGLCGHLSGHSVLKLPPFSQAMTTDSIISKAWSLCRTLRPAVAEGYGDYIVHLTCLIFLSKSKPPRQAMCRFASRWEGHRNWVGVHIRASGSNFEKFGRSSKTPPTDRTTNLSAILHSTSVVLRSSVAPKIASPRPLDSMGIAYRVREN
jgi:hypothetical protein